MNIACNEALDKWRDKHNGGPGIAEIFYGDETGRGLSDARFNVDSNQAFRSDMNWHSVNQTPLNHFRKLGQIRKNNPVIGNGKQKTIDKHMFTV